MHVTIATLAWHWPFIMLLFFDSHFTCTKEAAETSKTSSFTFLHQALWSTAMASTTRRTPEDLTAPPRKRCKQNSATNSDVQQEGVKALPLKQGSSTLPPKQADEDRVNPYLAHMYNGGGRRPGKWSSPLDTFVKHKTTASMAESVQDGPQNPFTGVHLSARYFNILKTRRNLPVHVQR